MYVFTFYRELFGGEAEYTSFFFFACLEISCVKDQRPHLGLCREQSGPI